MIRSLPGLAFVRREVFLLFLLGGLLNLGGGSLEIPVLDFLHLGRAPVQEKKK